MWNTIENLVKIYVDNICLSMNWLDFKELLGEQQEFLKSRPSWEETKLMICEKVL